MVNPQAFLLRLRDNMKYMKSGIVTILCVLSMFTDASSKTIDAGLGITFQSTHTLPEEYRDHAKHMILEQVWTSIAFVESGSEIRIDNFPISLSETGTIELQLVPSTVDGSTELYIGNERIPIPQVRTFTGHVKNEPGSTILLTHAHGELSGWVERANGTRVHIAPMEETDNSSHHMLYDQQIQGELRKSGGTCMTDESAIIIPTPEDLYAYLPKSDKTFGNNLLELQVIVEGTTPFFNGPGRKDSMRTAEFMIGLMNGVNSLYRKELNIAIVIQRLQI